MRGPPDSRDLTIVLRECGERTSGVCGERLARLFPGTEICRVSADNFVDVLRASLEAGLARCRAWTLCIDADVLVLPELREFLNEACVHDADLFAAQALVHDKLMLSARPAGNHLYRTELIDNALPLIPATGALRPETIMIQAMGIKGFGFFQSRRLVGVHDYAQWFRDIYAKAYLHAHKHAELLTLFEPAWRALAAEDADFRVALAAMGDALDACDVPTVMRNRTADAAEAALKRLGLDEKATIEISGNEEEEALAHAVSALPSSLAATGLPLQQAFNALVFAPKPGRTARGLASVRASLRCAARWGRILLPVLRATSARAVR
jgi:hypothetical protein